MQSSASNVESCVISIYTRQQRITTCSFAYVRAIKHDMGAAGPEICCTKLASGSLQAQGAMEESILEAVKKRQEEFKSNIE